VHVHLLCAVPNGVVLEYLPLFDALLERPLDVVEGRVRPSSEPGHGVRFRDDVLAPHLVASSRLTAGGGGTMGT